MAPKPSELIVDLSNYKDRMGGRVPPERYLLQLEDTEIDSTRNGDQMINLFWRVAQGDEEGETILDRLILSEKAMFRVVGFLQAMGIPTPKKRFKINFRKFVGRMILADLDDGDPYNGRVRSEVRGYINVPKSQDDDEPELPSDDDGDDDEAQEKSEPEPKPKAKKETDDDIDLDDIDLG